MAKHAPPRKTVRQYIDQNPIEAIRSIGGGVVRAVKDDVIAESADTFWEQFLGAERKQQLSGDLTEGMEIDLRETRKGEIPAMPGIDYHREVRTAEVKVIRENEAQLQQRIAQIQLELKKLIASSRELQVVFKQVTVETVPSKPGTYHKNFFEWLLSIIKQARFKVDESKSWLATFYAKRAKRQYWAMFKKHGTTFGLSHERVVATQTG